MGSGDVLCSCGAENEPAQKSQYELEAAFSGYHYAAGTCICPLPPSALGDCISRWAHAGSCAALSTLNCHPPWDADKISANLSFCNPAGHMWIFLGGIKKLQWKMGLYNLSAHQEQGWR